MNIKSPLKKLFTILLWCLLGGTSLALLIAAINAKNSSGCQGMEVEINKGDKNLFLNKKDVFDLLETYGLKNWQYKKIASFNLQQMESTLRRNSWIRDVQIYFDNNQILKIRILERQPVARLFTVSGTSFLIDSSGMQMPLSERSIFRLPVFTGYPSERFGLRRDSTLNSQVKEFARFIDQDAFWASQIQEVHINAAKEFELTPLIGSQHIEFGDGSDLENKFHRLFLFYREVLMQAGFDKYTEINLAYAGQVIATRNRSTVSRADSMQARKNVLDMIRMAQKIESDTAKMRDVKPLERNTQTEQSLRSYDLPEENDKPSDNKHQKQQ